MRMSFLIAAATSLALVLGAGAARADEALEKLSQMCKDAGEKPETCDCQAKAVIDNVDAKVVQVLILQHEGKSEEEAVKEAGLTIDEYRKLQEAATPKLTEAMAACEAQ